MKYKFKKEITMPPKGSKVKALIEYGVERESLSEEIKSLYHIIWHGWTQEEIQMIIDKIYSLSEGEIYEYQVVGSDLFIQVDYNYASFFDWRTSSETEDFSWTKEEFLVFLKDFKKFIEENS